MIRSRRRKCLRFLVCMKKDDDDVALRIEVQDFPSAGVSSVSQKKKHDAFQVQNARSAHRFSCVNRTATVGATAIGRDPAQSAPTLAHRGAFLRSRRSSFFQRAIEARRSQGKRTVDPELSERLEVLHGALFGVRLPCGRTCRDWVGKKHSRAVRYVVEPFGTFVPS